MLKLKKVAVTGGLSCGKSTVCRILEEFGAHVVSADKIAHQLLSSDANLGQEIIRLLGPSVLVNQKLDRSHIAHIVFHNLELLKALEELVHPGVYRELDKDYQQQQHHPHPPTLFIAEIPLLFESGGQRGYDFTVAVVANMQICCKRFQEATGQNQKEFKKRMGRQLSLFMKAILADYVIINNGTLSDLRQATIELYQELTENE